MSKKPQDEFVFDGFEQSNTTPVPDIFFDKLLSKLSGAEIKVLLYIIRRTAGFKKTTDAISLSQFEKGIIRADGTVLDEGCGLSRETICKTLDSLEAKGYIKRHKRNGTGTNNDVSLYSIRFKGEPRVVRKSDQVVRKSDQQKGSQKNRPASQIRRKKVVRKSDPQETVIQQTEGTYGNGNSETPNNSHSSTLSPSSLSEKTERYNQLVAEATRLQEEILDQATSESVEYLSTPIVDKPVSDVEKSELPIAIPTSTESVTTRNASIERHTEKLDPLGIYDEQEKQQHQWWCQLGLAVKVNLTNKGHWATLSEYVQSFEQFESLFKYTEKQLEADPKIPDKTVSPGNLANAKYLNGWKQERRRAERPSKPKTTIVDPLAKMRAIGAQFMSQGVN